MSSPPHSHDVVVAAARQPIIDDSTFNQVGAIVANEKIVATSTANDVVALSTAHQIGMAAAGEIIIGSATE